MKADAKWLQLDKAHSHHDSVLNYLNARRDSLADKLTGKKIDSLTNKVQALGQEAQGKLPPALTEKLPSLPAAPNLPELPSASQLSARFTER